MVSRVTSLSAFRALSRFAAHSRSAPSFGFPGVPVPVGLCRTQPLSAALRRSPPHSAALCRTPPLSAALRRTPPHSAALRRTPPHSAALRRTSQLLSAAPRRSLMMLATPRCAHSAIAVLVLVASGRRSFSAGILLQVVAHSNCSQSQVQSHARSASMGPAAFACGMV